MAFVNGQSLKDKIQTGPMKVTDFLNYGIGICHGLQHAHDKKVIHRDIKSANILVNEKEQIKITDFGLAKLVGDTALTKTGTIMGTAAYMSPEQVKGEQIDHRSDIWSTGVVLYELLTGRLPFKGDSDHAITHQIVNEEVKPLSSVRSDISLEIERVVSKCLEKDLSYRYQHIDDLLADLKKIKKDPKAQTKTKKSFNIFIPITLILSTILLYLIFNQLSDNYSLDTFSNPLEQASFRILTDLNGAKDAAISPDGNFVAFVSNHEGENDIWVTQVESGNTFNRTKGEYGDMRRGLIDVGFSGNSADIISFSTSRNVRVRSLPLFDGSLKPILRDSVIHGHWSPDGKQIVYFTDSPGDPIFIANSDGTNYKEILAADSGMHQHYQRWSLDGEWIYMVRGREDIWETNLWRIRPDGTELEQLTEQQVDVKYPIPLDSNTVLFIARDENGAGPWIWGVDLETKKSFRVSIGLEEYSSLSISNDGKRIVTAVNDQGSRSHRLWSIPIKDEISTDNDAAPYDFPAQMAVAPRFGGSTLFFLSTKSWGNGLWKYENGQVYEVWNDATSPLFNVPTVSPDGKTVAITLNKNGNRKLYLLNSDGSNLRLLNDSIIVRGAGSWSPDGKWIAIGGNDHNGHNLFKVSTTDGHHEVIINEDCLNPVWSPNGDLIVYSGKQISGFSTLEAVRMDGTKVDMPEIKVWVRGERYRFMPDGSKLIYTEGWFTVQNFWMLDMETMVSRQLTDIKKNSPTRTFDISPDGKSIIYDKLEEKVNIVLIELPDSTEN